jgi:hypothetical protein
MRLLRLQDNNVSLTDYSGKPPRYAILSHTWGADDEEVSFRDILDGTGSNKEGYRKLIFCGQQAARHGLEYYWVDTCCIDKSSSAELTEAINSMFRWYQDSERCYVYLSDVSTDADSDLMRWKPDFRKSRWFTRGWTLQELIAPKSVEFYSQEGYLLGNKLFLKQSLCEVTGIAFEALDGTALDHFSVEDRLSWAAKRTTKREEDAAYSLLGLFDIHMPMIYGEGRQKAFRRLLREIDDAKDAAPSKACNADERSKLAKAHEWLSAAEPSSNYQQALKLRQHNTGLWLLKSGQYQAWKTDPASFLWIHGIPGSGKTILSSTILEEVLRPCSDIQEKAVLYFYFDFNDSQKQDAESMLRSLISQLLRRSTTFPSSLDSLFLLHENGRQQPSSDELLKSLRQLIQGSAQTYVVLDALDECSQRSELMEILTRMGGWQLQNSHVVVTSRRERDIEAVMHKISSRRNHICLESEVIDEDIRQYVRQRLSDDTVLNKWGKDIVLRQEIETALIQGSQRMYVL